MRHPQNPATTTAASDAPAGGSVEGFAAKLRQDYDADYEPLATPRQAVEQSDLIVRGTVDNEAIVGTIAGVDELGPAWQTPDNVDELVQVIKSAR